MKNRNKIRSKHTDLKTKISSQLSLLISLFMFSIVMHDSFVHDLPFYYILFAIIGVFIGRMVTYSQKVVVEEKSHKLKVKVGPIGIIIAVLLLLIRFFLGQIILEEFNVVWIADALYLAFIGVYYAKYKGIIYQLDNHVYQYLFNKSKEESTN